MNRFVKRLRALWRRPQLDRDLEDELRFHREMTADETGDVAAASRRFGNATAIKEACRDMWTFTWLETLWQDVRYAARTLRHSPVFAIATTAALALGIGANTTIYTVVSSALAFNMGVKDIRRLVFVTPTDASQHRRSDESYADYLRLRDDVKSVQSLAAYRFLSVNVSDSTGLPERYNCVQMTANSFRVACTTPVLGRDFSANDDRPGAAPVVILTYHVWQDRYGKDPAILGKTVRVNELPHTVIGVMPPKMQFPEDTDLWVPLLPELAVAHSGTNPAALFGRLADGIDIATARAELDTIARRLETQAPSTYRGVVISVHPFLDAIGIYSVRRLLIVVEFAVGFVLLIACADVANLLLARAASRMREISIRIAIGAGRARIIRQLLVESLLLSSVAGLLGWLVAMAGLRAFDRATSNAHAHRASWIDFSMNLHAFTYLVAISIGAGILFGLAPTLRLAKVDVNSAVKDGGHGAAGSRRSQRLANLLVVFEMVLCMALLTGAGITIRGSINTYTAPIGANTSHVLTMRINLPEATYPKAEDQVAFHQRLKMKLEALPGVEPVSLASSPPAQFVSSFPFELAGRPPADPEHLPITGRLVIGANYFGVLQTPVRRGRTFNQSEETGGAPVVVVNQSFAEKTWPGEDPIGKRLRLVRGSVKQPWLTVVGMVGDIQQNFQNPLERGPLIYLPYSSDPQRTVFVLARTAVSPLTLAEVFRSQVRDLDKNLPVEGVDTLENIVSMSRMNVYVWSILFTIFAGVALALAAVGLYAVVAHSVSQRTREIGVRMAVGGSARNIARLVLLQGIRPVIIGLVIGLPLAAAVTFVLRAALVGVAPGDPVSLAGAALVLALAAVLGCVIPALRAVRIDPVVALRCD